MSSGCWEQFEYHHVFICKFDNHCETVLIIFYSKNKNGGRGNFSDQIWRQKQKLLCGVGVGCLFGATERQVPLSLAVLSYH